MNKGFSKNIKAFLLIFVLVAVATIFIMPKANVSAYVNTISNHEVDRQGRLTLQVVDDDTGDVIEGAKLKISNMHYAEGDTEGNPTDGSTSTVSWSSGLLENTHFSKLPYYFEDTGNSDIFSYQNENKAIITIEEDTPPDGYQSISDKIVVNYSLENYEHDGDDIFPSGDPQQKDVLSTNNNFVVYNLNVSVTGSANAVLTSTYHDEYGAPEWTDYTLKIRYKKGSNPTPEPTGKLQIKKIVDGDLGEQDEEFDFVVTLDERGDPLSDREYKVAINDNDPGSYPTDENGVLQTIKLKHGDTAVIEGLPADASYTVMEEGADGYTVTKTNDTGTIEEDKTAEVEFKNTKNSTPADPEDDPKDDPSDTPADDPGDTPDDDPSDTPDDDPSDTPEGSKTPGKNTGVKTGDESNATLFAGGVVIAAMMLTVLVRRRRKNQ